MSVPVTIDLPSGYQRVAWSGRMGSVAVVAGAPRRPLGAALLVPGLTGSKEDYFAVLGGLHERGWAAAAVDLPGMFESEGSDDPADYALADLVADVASMLPMVADGAPVHLVGHSAGGLIARHVAVARPDAVKSLTLYASGCGGLTEQAAATTTMMCQLLGSASPVEVHQLKRRMDAASGRPAPPETIERFLDRRWQGTTAGHLLGMAQVALSAPDALEALSDLVDSSTVPVLALYGERDDATWSLQQFAQLARLATRAEVIPDAEHSPAVENPAAMVEALDAFWRDHR